MLSISDVPVADHHPAIAATRSWVPWLAASVVWLLLVASMPAATLHSDTTRDLAMARDCAELGHCATGGATTSLSGLRQGALWLDLLALGRSLAIEPGALHHVLLALHAAVAGVAVAWARRRSAAGWRAAPLLLLASCLAAAPVLWNPMAMLPFATLGTLAALAWLERPGAVAALLAGALLGLAVDTHPIAIVLLFAVLAQGAVRSRARQAALVGLAAAAVLALVSPATLFDDGAALVRRPALAAGLVGLAATTGVLAWILRKRAPPAMAMAVTSLLAVVAGNAVLEHSLSGRYLVPALPPLALAIALLPPAPRRLEMLFVSLVALAIGLRMERIGGRQAWTYADAHRTSEMLSSHGLVWPELLLGVQGPDTRQLALAATIWLPASGKTALELPDFALVPAAPQPGSGWQPLGPWAMRLARQRLDLAHAEVCVVPQDPGREVGKSRECVPLRPSASAARSDFLFGDRLEPFVMAGAESMATMELRVPVRSGPLRVVQVLGASTAPCPWQGPGGAAEIVVPAEARQLLLYLHLPPDCASAGRVAWLPNLLETAPEDAWARLAASR